MSLKLGLKPATYSKKDLLFTEFTPHKSAIREAPVGFGVERMLPDWGMLGNDQCGDCAWAGPAHEHMLWGKLGGHPVSFTTENVLSDYAACTGFDPTTGANDNGTDMRNGLDYRRKVGIIDANGKRHKIGGYCSLEPGNWHQLLQALDIFVAVAIGIEVPQSAMDQFNAGKPWTVVAGSPIEDGHYIPGVARPGFAMIDIVTWAKTQQMTRQFYHKYNDQAFGVFSHETIVKGKSPEGFDLADFRAALASL